MTPQDWINYRHFVALHRGFRVQAQIYHYTTLEPDVWQEDLT